MRKTLLFISLCFFVIQAFPQKYVKVWSDEFNTPGLPDSTKWDYENGKIRNNELQYYTYKRSENARIQDTVLIIEARKEAYKGASYTSASLISRYKGDWLYGKFEISAKVPTGKGTWPAIWMMPTDDAYGGWPRSGEIDIMEYVGMNPSNLYFTAHFGSDSGAGHKSSHFYTTQISQPYNKFIKFTLIWTPDKLEWFANGVRYHTYNRPSDDPKVWPFNKMFYMILNLAYGGSWGAQQGIDDTKLPHKFYIDYVRIYQVQDTEGPYSLTIQPSDYGTVDVSPKLDSYPEGTKVTVTAVPNEKYEFDKWLHVGAANPMTIEVSKNTTLTPVFKKKNELLLNGDFNLGLKGWGNYYFQSTQWKATGTVEDGIYRINITQPGTANWHIVDQQTGITLLQGTTYLVSFEAWADNPNQMDVFLSKNHSDYGAYYSTVKNITKTRQKFTWTVKMNSPTDPNCRFGFGVGRFTGNVYIDNMSVEKVVPTGNELPKINEDEFRIFPNPTSGEILISGNTFDLPVNISLFSLEGKLISSYQSFPIGNQLKVNLKSKTINPGIYLLQINSSTKTQIRKVILN